MSPTATPKRARKSRRAFVLVAVLIVVVLLSLAAYQYSELMTAEYRAGESAARAAQARAFAEAGIHYAAAALASPDSMSGLLGNNTYDNAQAFQHIAVNPQARAALQGRFSLLSLVNPDDANAGSQPFRFGVTDESGKINPNAIMQIDSSGQVLFNMLLTLPNMTEDVANSIVDWLDADDQPRTDGAEVDYYQGLSPPYRCKNGPLDSVEEMLFIKGVTPLLLLGNDRNRNGLLERDEDDGSGTPNRGWSAYLTVYSRELNVDSQGNPRIYVNDNNNLQQLQQSLASAVGEPLANFIIAYRLYGPVNQHGGAGGGGGAVGGVGGGVAGGGAPRGGGAAPPAAGGVGVRPPMPAPGGRPAPGPVPGGMGGGMPGAPGGGMPGAPGRVTAVGGGGGMIAITVAGGAGGGASINAPPGATIPANALNYQSNSRPRSIASLYELINARVSIPGQTPQSPATIYQSPLNDQGQRQQLLPTLLDALTTSRGTEIPARINVNTASPTVLAALPGIQQSDVQNIIAHRPDPTAGGTTDPTYQTTAWLVLEANVSPSTMQSLDRYITARTQVYRVQSVGYFDQPGPAARVEAVIDTNLGYPRILYRRDLTELGKGFDLGTVPSSK